MADAAHQENQGENKEKFSLFNLKEWPEFVRNWYKRLPLTERFRWGRRNIGKRKEPTFYEIDKTWLRKNNVFYSVLETIEDTWGSQGHLMGQVKKGNLTSNPEGIVRLYMDFGVYSDI